MFSLKPQSVICNQEQDPEFYEKDDNYSSDYETKISYHQSTEFEIKNQNIQTRTKYYMVSTSINSNTCRDSCINFENQECSSIADLNINLSNEVQTSKLIRTQHLHSNSEVQNIKSPFFQNKKFLQQLKQQNQQNINQIKFQISQSIQSEKLIGINIQKSNQENSYQFLKIETFKENKNQERSIQKSDDHSLYNLVVLPENIKSIEQQIHLFLDQSNMNQINIQQYLDSSFIIDSAKIRSAFKDQRDIINSDKQQSQDSSSLIQRRKKLIKQITLSSQTQIEQNKPLNILKSSQSFVGSCNDFNKKLLQYQSQNLKK